MFKESKQRQTHSLGDGCGSPAHNFKCNECGKENLKDWFEFDDGTKICKECRKDSGCTFISI